MGRFYEKSADERYGSGSTSKTDYAENAVRKVMADLGRPVVDFGPKHVPTDRAQQMTWPEVVRYTPDFLGFGRFIEAQGSNGRTVIFKEPKLNGLIFWNGMMPVWFGIYNMAKDTVIFADLPSVLWACRHELAVPMILDEGTKGEKKAFEIPLELLYEVKYHNAFEAAKKDAS